MHQEKYSLTWHTYSDHLRDMMKELLMNDDFADVTLVTEDKKHMKAHKNILSACSFVFKDMFQQEDMKLNSFIYLRGVQFSELESIMQFIYLGEATFYEERMNEFLSVARSLEIKDISNAETDKNGDNEPLPNNSVNSTDNDDEPSLNNPMETSAKSEEQPMRSGQPPRDIKLKLFEIRELCNAVKNTKYITDFTSPQSKPITSTDNDKEEQNMSTSSVINQTQVDILEHQDKDPQTLNRNMKSEQEGVKYACDQCDSQFTQQNSLKYHIKSVHEGIRYSCDQCDYKAKAQSNLRIHIQSKHEGIMYNCDQCDYQATRQVSLKTHIESIHEGIKYACDHCDHKATSQGNLSKHIKTKHEGVRYACDQCEFQATRQFGLRKHIQSIHESVKYFCDQCDYQFSKKENLKNHIESKHEGVKKRN